MISEDEENNDCQMVDEPDITGPDAAAARDGTDSDGTDDGWVVIRHPRLKNGRPQRDHKVPTKAGSEVREEDLERQNIGRRLQLTSSQKRKRKQRQRMAAFNQHSPSPISPSPNTEGHIRSLNFEIPIRAVRSPDGREPFPKVGEFMSLWGASSKEKD